MNSKDWRLRYEECLNLVDYRKFWYYTLAFDFLADLRILTIYNNHITDNNRSQRCENQSAEHFSLNCYKILVASWQSNLYY